MKTSRSTDRAAEGGQKKGRKKIFAKYMQRKLAFAFLGVTLALFALCVVLARINRDKGNAYAQTVLSQYTSYNSNTVIAARGEICDRNGAPLAMNEKVYNLIIDAKEIVTAEKNIYLDETVRALAEAFGYDQAEMKKLIQDNPNSRYIRYARQLPESEKEKFEAIAERINSENKAQKDEKGKASNPYRVGGVWFETEYKRVYPYGNLACELLGFASTDGTSGNWGLEQYYNDLLVGRNGRTYSYLNEEGGSEIQVVAPQNGSKLITTIDSYIQGVVQKHIREFNKTYGSRNTGVVVMDPNTGEVLAMASDDEFDLNSPYDLSGLYTEEQLAGMTDEEIAAARLDLWRNYCISDTYEPGSTGKVFTLSAALEEGVVKTTDGFDCNGYQDIAGRVIKCWYHAGHGMQSLKQTLVNSCNDAMMQIAAKMGTKTFTKYQKLFGLGQKTGIDLPGEADASGLIYYADTMRVTDLATNSFGQNYNVTLIQMASAYCSAVNGGKYFRPHFLKRVVDSTGTVVKNVTPVLVKETVSEETSRFLREALLAVVEDGTSHASAAIPGYHVAGKTGTAEKYPRGNGKYVVSFISAVPAENPEVIVYAVIDEPQTDRPNSNSWACKLNRSILKEILPYLNIYPENGEVVTPEDPFGTDTDIPDVGPNDPTGEIGDVFTNDDNDLAPAGTGEGGAEQPTQPEQTQPAQTQAEEQQGGRGN